MSADLGEVTFWLPGVLNKTTETENLPADIQYTPLMLTTPQGNAWAVSSPYELRVPDYAEILRRFRDGTSPQVLAYRVTGSFHTAFPDGPPKSEQSEDSENNETPKEEKHAEHLAVARQPAAVVVVADVDFLSDAMAYQRTIFGLAVVGSNSAFVLNALEELSGSTDLISLRSRGNYKRPFTRVDQIEKAAEEKTSAEESRIMAEIKGFQSQLNEKLSSLENKEQELINKTILNEKKEIEVKLHEAEMRLRDVKMKKVADKEALKNRLRNFCTLPGPLFVLLIAVGLGLYRGLKRRYYIHHIREP